MQRHAVFTSACWIATAAAMCAAARVQAQQHSVHPVPPRNIQAVERFTPVRLDGLLSEPIWRDAPDASDFIQRQPHEGEPATQRTEVRFAYDADAVYIGARMFDDLGAAGVTSRLVRRDGEADADLLMITFDTFHDHLGRTVFSINPSGVKGDAYGPGASHPDRSWDPVWDAATLVDSLGWTAEIRIPLSQLRFPRDSVQTWGLQVERMVNRLNEHSQWAFWPLTESGGPTWFGHLENIQLASSPARVEFLPYVVGRSSSISGIDPNDPFNSAHEFGQRIGVDLTYLLTSNLTLTGTLNPDFGQVEVDPAVVNLSDYETFYPERRPFFVEGRGYLRYGGIWCYFCSNISGLALFYSRRVGRSPQCASDAYDAGEYADVPDNTTILGAAKITGRTMSGWTVGVLNAVTSRERADVADIHGNRFSQEVEPFTNYFVGSLAKDLRGGSIQVGGMMTSVVRDLDNGLLRGQLTRHAEGFGLQSEAWWANRTYRLATQLAFSQVAGDTAAIRRVQESSVRYFQRPDRQHGSNGLFTDRFDPTLTSMRGFAGHARLSKESGDWLWELSTMFKSPGFEVNDIAFLPQVDMIWMSVNVIRRFTKPTKLYRSLALLAGGQQRFNFDGDLIGRDIQTYFEIELPNYWRFNTFFIHRPTVLDDRRLRGGPVVKKTSINYWFLAAHTDSRKNFLVRLNPAFGWDGDGSRDYELSLDVTYRPAPNVSVSVGPSFNHGESRAQYVTSVEDPTATDFYGRRYVFADLVLKRISMNTRLNITFTPTLSFEVFAQPLISSGEYTNFKEFAAPRELDKLVYGTDVGTVDSDGESYTVDPDGAGPAETFSFEDPNFNFRSLRGNAVLRWEFLPGSTLFLVWTHQRSHTAPIGDLSFGRDVEALFDAPSDNVFLVKLNYWWAR